MLPTLFVKSAEAIVRANREATAKRVLACFEGQLPDLALLCFFDDDDWRALKHKLGKANRGIYQTDIRMLGACVPSSLRQCLVEGGHRVFDRYIYLHGSTCSNAVGLTMTFAHELQHFVQYGKVRGLWAAGHLIMQLLDRAGNPWGLTVCDVPHEREARIVSKRTAGNLFRPEVVGQYIDAMIRDPVTKEDAADWSCIRALDTSAPFDLDLQTRRLFHRVKEHRRVLEQILAENQADPDFSDVNLAALFDGPRV